MLTLRIDDELRAFLPSLDAATDAALEEQLLTEGIRDPIVVWEHDGQQLILDGHRRFRIAQKHDLPFAVVVLRFATKAEAMDWILRNQLVRRNVTQQQRNLCLARLRQMLPGTASEKLVQLIELSDLSRRQVYRVLNYAEAFARLPGWLQDAISRNEIASTADEVTRLGNMPDAEQAAAIRSIPRPPPKGAKLRDYLPLVAPPVEPDEEDEAPEEARPEPVQVIQPTPPAKLPRAVPGALMAVLEKRLGETAKATDALGEVHPSAHHRRMLMLLSKAGEVLEQWARHIKEHG